MGGHRDVDDAATVMGQDDQHEQQSIRHSGYDEEVSGCDLMDMIREERPPCLGWRAVTARHVLRDRRLADVDAQLHELTVDSRRAPQRIGCRHRTNQAADLRRDRRSAQAVSTFPRP
jgi:hypothetical protein